MFPIRSPPAVTRPPASPVEVVSRPQITVNRHRRPCSPASHAGRVLARRHKNRDNPSEAKMKTSRTSNSDRSMNTRARDPGSSRRWRWQSPRARDQRRSSLRRRRQRSKRHRRPSHRLPSPRADPARNRLRAPQPPPAAVKTEPAPAPAAAPTPPKPRIVRLKAGQLITIRTTRAVDDENDEERGCILRDPGRTDQRRGLGGGAKGRQD